MDRPAFTLWVALLLVATGALARADDGIALGDPLRLSPGPDGLVAGEGAGDGFSITFTPRLPSVLSGDDAELRLNARPVIGVEGGALSDPSGAPGLTARSVGGNVEAGEGLVVGGALNLGENFRLGGEFAHREGGLSAGDRLSASLGYGGLTTRFGYTELDGLETGGERRLSLGAEVDAGEGMRFGADILRVDPESDRESTTGVLRFNLDF